MRSVHNLVALESAHPDHVGTYYHINAAQIVSFYRSVSSEKTIVFMSDQRTYDVKESPDQLASIFSEVWRL